MIDRSDAIRIAQRELVRVSGELGLDVSLDLDATIETPTRWIFFWNSTAYLDSGSISDALAGNGPLQVDRETGSVVRLPDDYAAGGLDESPS